MDQKHKKLRRIFIYIFLAITSSYQINLFKQVQANENLEILQKASTQTFVGKAVARTGPAVVTIETQRTIYSNRSSIMPRGLLIDPYFERFFNFPEQRIPRSRIENGQGSGLIFSSAGLVLTNAHVIDKSEKLMVGLSDGRRVKGRVIGKDLLTDLAVISLEGTGPWPVAPLGDSNKIIVGDWAIAVGNPFGLANTVTLGIISNLNRNVSQLGITDKRIDLIQTDAAINPGNSGGPLLNANGEVIGINTLIRSGPGAGLGFAIPINKAKNIANQLVKKGKASHPVIGVSLSNMPLVDSKGNQITQKGAKIRYLIPNGPAEKGDLKIGDIILEVGNEIINNASDVVRIINNNEINNPLLFKIKRKEEIIYLYIVPTDLNEMEMR
tara:strand:+ start:19799 stop:20947 length:1149 start_codon:yes stop_codon:yes gene_type:complete